MKDILIAGAVLVGGYMLLHVMRPGASLGMGPYATPNYRPPAAQPVNQYTGYGQLAQGIGTGLGSLLGGIGSIVGASESGNGYSDGGDSLTDYSSRF